MGSTVTIVGKPDKDLGCVSVWSEDFNTFVGRQSVVKGWDPNKGIKVRPYDTGDNFWVSFGSLSRVVIGVPKEYNIGVDADVVYQEGGVLSKDGVEQRLVKCLECLVKLLLPVRRVCLEDIFTIQPLPGARDLIFLKDVKDRDGDIEE